MDSGFPLWIAAERGAPGEIVEPHHPGADTGEHEHLRHDGILHADRSSIRRIGRHTGNVLIDGSAGAGGDRLAGIELYRPR